MSRHVPIIVTICLVPNVTARGASTMRSAIATSLIHLGLLVGPASAIPPDPTTECALANVTCVAPNEPGGWHAAALSALQAGQDVYLTDGDLGTEDDYPIPLASSPRLPLDFANQLIRGEGMYNTTFHGDLSQIAIEVTEGSNQVHDMHIYDVKEAIRIAWNDWNDVTIRGVKVTSVNPTSGQPIRFPVSENPGNSGYNILVEDCLFDDMQLVTHFADVGGVTIDQKYPKFKDSTFIRIRNDIGTGVVADAPWVPGDEVYLIEIEGCTMDQSDNHWYEDFLDNLDGGRGSSGSRVIQTPRNNIEGVQLGCESQDGSCPNPNHYTLASSCCTASDRLRA